jgi:hypothetical protein
MKYNISMHKLYTLLAIGIWVAVLPYLGFPHSLKGVFFTLSGLGVVILSYIFYKEGAAREEDSKNVTEESTENYDNFSENDLTDEGEI